MARGQTIVAAAVFEVVSVSSSAVAPNSHRGDPQAERTIPAPASEGQAERGSAWEAFAALDAPVRTRDHLVTSAATRDCSG